MTEDAAVCRPYGISESYGLEGGLFCYAYYVPVIGVIC